MLLAATLLGAPLAAADRAPPPPRHPVSWIDTRAALSAVHLHRGLVIAPLGSDHGGGNGVGALAVYDVRDPATPVCVFDSRDHKARYHTRGGRDYLGDSTEYHHAIMSGDRGIFADRGPGRAGFYIVDFAPLYDRDPATLPAVVCRYTFPGVANSTNYDGFSFALEWAGGRYVYAPTGSHGLFVIDTADPAQPELIAHLPNARLANQTLRAAVALGDLLVVSPVAVNVKGGKALVLDISNPREPSVLNTFTVSMGYQGFLYGSRFFNVATAADGRSPARLLAWDLSDPQRITELHLLTTTGIKNAEYGYGKDGDLIVGHYPGAMRWSMATGRPVLVDRIEPQEPPGDDYAFISPVGNLVAVTSDHQVRSRLNFAPLDRPDTVPPVLLHARPANGATGVERTTGIGLAFSDFLDTGRLAERPPVLRKAGATATVPATCSHLTGIINLVPVAPLDPDTTYEVVVDPAALRDQVGNAFAGPAVLLRFSTGGMLTPYNVEIRTDQPRPVGGEVTITLRELAPTGTRLEHAWDFGDGTTLPFDRATVRKHRFTTPANHVVTVSSRRSGETTATRRTAVQVVHRPAAPRRPVASGSIALDAAGTTVFAVNPDHGSVAALEATTLVRRWEVAVGREPAGIAVGTDGRVWATLRGADQVVILASGDGAQRQVVDLPRGSAPHGIVLTGDRVYVACAGRDLVLELDARNGAIMRQVAAPDPRHLAWDPLRDRLVVPRFLSRGMADGAVTLIDRPAFSVRSTITLVPSPGPDGGADGRGSPNYLAAPAISPDLGRAWLPGKKDNLARGPRRDGQPMTFDHTVRSLGVRLDLERQSEDLGSRIDFDNSDFTTAAVFSPLGNRLFFAALGSRVIWAVDAEGDHDRYSFDAGGEGPIGLAMAPDGRTLYVHHLLSRSVAAIDVGGVVDGNGLVGATRSGATVAKEVLPPQVLAGKKLFHDTTRSELSQEGYMSCAACHMDGSHDGRVWDMTQFGEGLRNTIDLRGRAGMGHGSLHWSGNFDEVQDFEGQIRSLTKGAGLLAHPLFNAHRQAVQAADGDPKGGLSQPLDQLAAYVASLDRIPANAVRPAGGPSPAAKRGRAHFIALDCMRCHRGPAFTDSAPGVRHDVGTLTAASGARLGRPLDGLDTPTLLDLDRSAPYLHDGSAASLDAVLTTRNAAQQHGATKRLTASERADLVAFLRELQPEDAPTLAEVAPGQSPPRFTAAPSTIDLAIDTAPGTVLATFAATDADAGQRVRYRLAQGPDVGFFRIDASTGVLRWNGAVPARAGSYRVDVVAEDDGRLPASTGTTLAVQLVWPPAVVERTVNDKQQAQLRIAWRHLGAAQRYRLEAGPAQGPFKEFANRSFGHAQAGQMVDWRGSQNDLKGGTHVRVVAEISDPLTGRRADRINAILAMPAK